MAKVIIKGSGQLNGTVVINKALEMDIAQARVFVGAKKDEALIALIAVHYPGVKINPKQLSVVVDPK